MDISDYNQDTFILVVDDDETLLKFFKIHLTKFFSKIIVVSNPREAVGVLQEKKIDLVLSDIRMPKLDGMQLMKKIRGYDPSIPVFLVSGAPLEDQMEDIETKADGFLRKPFSIDELHNFIIEGLRVRILYERLFQIVDDSRIWCLASPFPK